MANVYLGIIFFLIGLAFWFVNFGPWELGVVSIVVAFVLGFFGFLIPKPKLSTLEELNKKLQMLTSMQGIFITRLYKTQSVIERAELEKDLLNVSLDIQAISKQILEYKIPPIEEK